MSKKQKPMKDDEIVSLIGKHIHTEVEQGGARLSRERVRAMRHYAGELPAKMHEGDSSYVSSDVFDTVEGAKSMLIEAFSAGRRPVEFTPIDAQDIEPSRIATAYCSHVLFAQNPGERILDTIIMDGLMARAGVTKTYWKEEVSYEDSEVQGTLEEIVLGVTDGEIDEDSLEIVDPVAGTVKAKVRKKINKSRVVIEPVRPEDFFITATATSIEDAPVCGDRSFKTRKELQALGLDEEQLNKLSYSKQTIHYNSIEKQNRIADLSDGLDEELEDKAEVYDAYIRANIDGTGSCLWNVFLADRKEIIHKKKIGYPPYQAYVPLPVPHRFLGTNFALKVVPHQIASTLLVRSIINHALITNNPRYTVLKGGLTSPRELMENKLGGIVNITRDNAIGTIPQQSLNPHVFQTLQMLDADKEDASGVSRLSQGINKDVISKQNSAALVEQMASLSMQRTKTIARRFGLYIKELFLAINRLILDHEDRQRIVNVAGNWVEVDPQQWKERQHCNIDLTLGYGTGEKEAMQRLQVYQFLAEDPAMQGSFSPKHRYALAKTILDKLGLIDHAEFLEDPVNVQPPQPTPEQQLAVEMQQAQIEAQRATTQMQMMELQHKIEMDRAKMQLEMFKAQSSQAIAADKVDIAEANLAHKKVVDKAELALAERADTINAVASPEA